MPALRRLLGFGREVGVFRVANFDTVHSAITHAAKRNCLRCNGRGSRYASNSPSRSDGQARIPTPKPAKADHLPQREPCCAEIPHLAAMRILRIGQQRDLNSIGVFAWHWNAGQDRGGGDPRRELVERASAWMESSQDVRTAADGSTMSAGSASRSHCLAAAVKALPAASNTSATRF